MLRSRLWPIVARRQGFQFVKPTRAITSLLPAISLKLSAHLVVGIAKMAPIATSAGQRAAINAKGHEIYLMNRAAQNAAPLPPSIPGMHQYWLARPCCGVIRRVAYPFITVIPKTSSTTKITTKM
jgi:hypothetical protein